jgi:hypothetical protein
MPESYERGYSADDIAMLGVIVDFLNKHQKNRAWLFETARVDKGTGSLVINGKYGAERGSSPATHLKKLFDAVQTFTSRADITAMPWVETSTYKLVVAACNRARKYKTFAVITGHVGTGKTGSLKKYASAQANTVLIEADPLMSAGSLIDELIRATNTDTTGCGKTVEKRYKALMAALTNTETLIILDEAENVSDKALHYIRRLRDKCGIGIVLCGREELYGKITPPVHAAGGEFDQIHSRAGFMPATIRAITPDDADALVRAFFADIDDINAATMARFRAWSKGCARMLVENLMPTVRDYGLTKHALSPELVDQVAKQVLNLKGEK